MSTVEMQCKFTVASAKCAFNDPTGDTLSSQPLPFSLRFIELKLPRFVPGLALGLRAGRPCHVAPSTKHWWRLCPCRGTGVSPVCPEQVESKAGSFTPD